MTTLLPVVGLLSGTLTCVRRMVSKLWLLCFLCMGLTFASVVFGEEAPLEIEKILCEGNEKSTCGFIQSQTSLQENERVDEEKIKEAKLRLQLIGYFEEVEIRLNKGSAPGRAVMMITVKERSSYSYSASAGAAYSDEWLYGALDVTGTNKNLTGSGDSLSLRIRDDYDKHFNYKSRFNDVSARIEYIRPGFLFPRLYLIGGVGAKYTNYSIKDNSPIFGAGYDNWDYFKSWADLALGYKIFNYSFLSLGYRQYLLNRTSNLFLQYGWNSQDDDNFPTQGSQLLINLDWSRPFRQQSTHYINFTGSFLQHFRLADGHVLSLKIGGFKDLDPNFYVSEDRATSIRYTRILKKSADKDIKKTAYYIEPGYFYGFSGKNVWGARAGSTIQTDYGLVNLFLMGGVN